MSDPTDLTDLSGSALGEVRRVLAELASAGPGSHVHLDTIAGLPCPEPGDPEWVELASRVAALALEVPGRFVVAVPLGTTDTVPVPFESGQAGLSAAQFAEPPAVYLAADQEPRTWAGEYYRLDLPSKVEGLREYLSAFRTQQERENGEPFDVKHYFETVGPEVVAAFDPAAGSDQVSTS